MEDNKEIKNLLTSFIENRNEIDKIRLDIQNYYKQFKNRLQQLKQENEKSEKILLKYLEDNKLPGIRSGDFLLLVDNKPVTKNKEYRRKKIDNIFENHQIDQNSGIYKEIIDVINNNPKTNESTEKKIKFKKYT